MRVRDRKAFTLIELLIVVAIIGIVSAVGYTQASVLIPRYRCYQAAREFASTIQMIRQRAATDGVEHRIFLSLYDPDYLDETTGNQGIYYVQSGNDSMGSSAWNTLQGEGTIDLSETSPKVSLVPWSALSGPTYSTASNENCIVISPRGWLVNPNSDFDSNGYIVVEFINKQALQRDVVETYQVKIARSGMVRLDINDARFSDVSGHSQGVDERSSSSSSASGGGAPS